MGLPVLVIGVVIAVGPVASAGAQSGSWEITPTPDQNARANQLLATHAVTANNVWAVGNYDAGPTVNTLRTLAEQWNGSAWSAVPTQNPETGNTDYDSLNGVSATAASDVWAVGYSGNADLEADQALIEHFNGTSWSVVPAAEPYQSQDLYAVSALSAKNAWAVGYGESNGKFGGLIEHWNGTAWKAVTNPATTELTGVAAISSNNVWAMGDSETATQMLHWNGSAWSIVPSPQPSGGEFYQLNGIAAVSAGNIWVVGIDNHPSGSGYSYDNFIEHWNGSTWQIVHGGQGDLGYDYLFGVAALSPTDVFAVGSDGGFPYIEKWNGSSWSQVPAPMMGSSNNTFQAATAIAGDFWAVGFYFDTASSSDQTLADTCQGC